MSTRQTRATTRPAQEPPTGDAPDHPPMIVADRLGREPGLGDAVCLRSVGGCEPTMIVVDLADRTVRAAAVPRRVRALAQAYPGIPLVLVCGLPDAAEAEAAAALGVRGFITGAEPVRVAIAALRLVAAGGSYLPRDAQEVSGPPRDPPPDAHARLTPREVQVLREVATRASNRDIGKTLGLSENTVKVYVRNLMRKMNARSRRELAARA